MTKESKKSVQEYGFEALRQQFRFFIEKHRHENAPEALYLYRHKFSESYCWMKAILSEEKLDGHILVKKYIPEEMATFNGRCGKCDFTKPDVNAELVRELATTIRWLKHIKPQLERRGVQHSILMGIQQTIIAHETAVARAEKGGE